MKKNSILTVLSILLVLVGVLSIIFGILMLNEDHGSKGDMATFGADFYNYINNNAARVATNTFYFMKTLAKGIGYCLIVAGATLIICGIMKLASNPKQVVINNSVAPGHGYDVSITKPAGAEQVHSIHTPDAFSNRNENENENELEDLFRSGLITEEEYNDLKQKHLK